MHNAGRSQMAEAFFNQLAQGKYHAASAGTEPAIRLNPVVVQVMAEAGIDIRSNKPKLLTPEMMKNVQHVITMGCGMSPACPALLAPAEDWKLPDPEGITESPARLLRDDIKARVIELIQKLNTNLTSL